MWSSQHRPQYQHDHPCACVFYPFLTWILCTWLVCVTCMLTRSTPQHILLCLNRASRDFYIKNFFLTTLWSMFVPKSCIWCGASCRLTYPNPPSTPHHPPRPSQWMWILTFNFDSLKDVALHDRLHFTVCLFILLWVLFLQSCVWLWNEVDLHSAPNLHVVFIRVGSYVIIHDHITSKCCVRLDG